SLFVPLSLAVGFAMLASYLLSSTLVPVLANWLLPERPLKEAEPWLARDTGSVQRGALALRWPLAGLYLLLAGGAGFWAATRASGGRAPGGPPARRVGPGGGAAGTPAPAPGKPLPAGRLFIRGGRSRGQDHELRSPDPDRGLRERAEAGSHPPVGREASG